MHFIQNLVALMALGASVVTAATLNERQDRADVPASQGSVSSTQVRQDGVSCN